MLGTYALSAGYYDAYYLKAQQVRTLIRQDFEQAFAGVDVIACPTTPTTAFRIGESAADPLSMYLADIFTLSLNLAGMCGVSLPCGFDETGLPVGLQLMGAAFDESTVLRTAYAYEQRHRVADAPPAVVARARDGRGRAVNRYPEGFEPFAERMRAEGLPDLAIRTFAHYYGQLRRGETGLVPEATLTPVTGAARRGRTCGRSMSRRGARRSGTPSCSS